MATTRAKALSNHVQMSQVGNTLIQSGSFQKTEGGSYSVNFRADYASPPVVLLTPFWNGHNASVPAETVVTITATGFTGFSGAAAPDYFVEWLAIGSTE